MPTENASQQRETLHTDERRQTHNVMSLEIRDMDIATPDRDIYYGIYPDFRLPLPDRLRISNLFAVATGKTITTTAGTKLVTVPKTSANKSTTPVIKVTSPGQAVPKTPKTSPQTSVMKVITGENQTKKTYSKGLKGAEVSGSNPYGPSENTRSQTKDRREYATQAAVTSYEKVVVDAIVSSSESEDPDEDVHHISNDEVSDDNEEHLSDGDETNEDQ